MILRLMPVLFATLSLAGLCAQGRVKDPMQEIQELIEPFRIRRHANGAAGLDLPEVSIRVEQGRVRIRQLPRLASRAMVTDAMLMAGVAAARF